MTETKPNRIIPNAYQSPNFYVDDLLPLLTGEEWKCMSFVIRKTIGWQKFKDRLAKSVIAEGTGLAEATVDKCMNNLVSFGLVKRTAENNGAHEGIEYEVQMEDAKIVWTALEERKQALASRNLKRTEAARKALKLKIEATPSVGHTPSVPHTPSVGQPGSPSVGQTPSPSVGQGTQKPIKTKNNISDGAKKAITSNPQWAIAAGEEYTPDPEQVALQEIREMWDRLMRTNTPWDRWEGFDKWLLAQEREGRRVETFCKWFTGDKFRREGIGMWTPAGNARGEWSFKRVYPQAYPTATAARAATDEPAPLDTPFVRAMNLPYVKRERPNIKRQTR